MEWAEDPFGSRNGEELVPPVNAADMKAVWQLYDESRRARPEEANGLRAVAMDAAVIEGVCRPGADVRNVWYRMAMLQLLFHVVEQSPQEHEAQTLAKLKRGEKLDDRLFEAMSKIPLKWLPEHGMHGYPFDVHAFIKEVEESGMTTEGPVPLTGFENLDRIIKQVNEQDATEGPTIRAFLKNAEESLAGFAEILAKIREPKPR
jgi:hypothetical protein